MAWANGSGSLTQLSVSKSNNHLHCGNCFKAAAHPALTPSLNDDRPAVGKTTTRLSAGFRSRHSIRNSRLPSVEPASKTMTAEAKEACRSAFVNDSMARSNRSLRLKELMTATISIGPVARGEKTAGSLILSNSENSLHEPLSISRRARFFTASKRQLTLARVYIIGTGQNKPGLFCRLLSFGAVKFGSLSRSHGLCSGGAEAQSMDLRKSAGGFEEGTKPSRDRSSFPRYRGLASGDSLRSASRSSGSVNIARPPSDVRGHCSLGRSQ